MGKKINWIGRRNFFGNIIRGKFLNYRCLDNLLFEALDNCNVNYWMKEFFQEIREKFYRCLDNLLFEALDNCNVKIIGRRNFGKLEKNFILSLSP